MYYRNAQSALVVYDLTKPTSLLKARHWVAELQRQASPGIVIALVGNKLDLTNPDPHSSTSAGDALADDDDDDEAAGQENEDGTADATDDNDADAEADARRVSTREARSYAEEEGLLFFETSAKTGTNVREVFTAIANAIPETQLKGPGRGVGGTGTALGAGSASGRGEESGNRVDLKRGAQGGAAGGRDGCAC